MWLSFAQRARNEQQHGVRPMTFVNIFSDFMFVMFFETWQNHLVVIFLFFFLLSPHSFHCSSSSSNLIFFWFWLWLSFRRKIHCCVVNFSLPFHLNFHFGHLVSYFSYPRSLSVCTSSLSLIFLCSLLASFSSIVVKFIRTRSYHKIWIHSFFYICVLL